MLANAELQRITHTENGASVDSLHLHGHVIRGRYGAANPHLPGWLLNPVSTTWNREGKHLKNSRLDLDLTPLQ
jgi:hypothetical protein